MTLTFTPTKCITFSFSICDFVATLTQHYQIIRTFITEGPVMLVVGFKSDRGTAILATPPCGILALA